VKPRTTVLLLVMAAVIAVLFFKGPAVVDEAIQAIMRALGKKEEANRQALIPEARAALDGLRAQLMEEHGIDTLIGQTKRTLAQQTAAQAIGASDTPDSWHLIGRAVDLYVYGPDGKPDMDGRHTDRYLAMHRVAAEHGWRGIAFDLETGKKKYLKSGKWDGGHLELRSGMSFTLARAKFIADGGVIA
jgi:hypothetical protein